MEALSRVLLPFLWTMQYVLREHSFAFQLTLFPGLLVDSKHCPALVYTHLPGGFHLLDANLPNQISTTTRPHSRIQKDLASSILQSSSAFELVRGRAAFLRNRDRCVFDNTRHELGYREGRRHRRDVSDPCPLYGEIAKTSTAFEGRETNP